MSTSTTTHRRHSRHHLKGWVVVFFLLSVSVFSVFCSGYWKSFSFFRRESSSSDPGVPLPVGTSTQSSSHVNVLQNLVTSPSTDESLVTHSSSSPSLLSLSTTLQPSIPPTALPLSSSPPSLESVESPSVSSNSNQDSNDSRQEGEISNVLGEDVNDTRRSRRSPDRAIRYAVRRGELNACDENGHSCAHGSTCVATSSDGSSNTGYKCLCPSGYTGPYCEQDIDECTETPGICHNGATCVNSPGSFSCVCVNGWTGTHCETNIDDCAQAKCFNGATCVDHVGRFTCVCPPGKTGLLCHLDDACASNPCRAEGSTCNTSPITGEFICTCPPGWTGVDCSKDIDECSGSLPTSNKTSALSRAIRHPKPPHSLPAISPCEHEGRCVNTHGSFYCHCQPGFTGARCEININECASNPCFNDGTCLDDRGFYRCLCMPGYTGTRCQTEIDECLSNPCQNGGICTDQVNGYKCVCPPGFTGPNCENNIDDCRSNPCMNGATCKDSLDAYICKCPPGFNGPNCENNIDDCANSPCVNGGTCIDGINSFTCKCPIGFTGILCQNTVNECLSSPCLFGGTCVDLIGEATVASNSTNRRDVINRAQLHLQILDGETQGYRCICPPGTTGPRCQTNLDDCWSNPCFNNGTCTDLINGFRCTCAPGYTGPTCSLDIDECKLGNVCRNGATCVNKDGGFECLCPPGYYEKDCRRDRDDCLSSPCMNGGICRDHPGLGHFSCLCPPAFTGSRCESRAESNVCNNNPCKHGSTCVPDSSEDGFKCACPPGFTGDRCETNINECEVNHCLNGGTCLDGINSFSCVCPLPFSGKRCEIYLDPCMVHNCSGHSQCVRSPDFKSYTCLCDPGFKGETCSEDIDECASSFALSGRRSYQDYINSRGNDVLCQNGGTCMNSLGSYTCYCPHGFTGPRCEINVNECATPLNGQPICLNGGTCLDGIASYTCACPQGFGGQRCERRIQACASSPCLQGARCTDAPESPGTYKCHCPLGFSGKNCQFNDDDCTPASCLNGGVCIDGINSFKCECPSGFNGPNCQFRDNNVGAAFAPEPTTICRKFNVIPGDMRYREQENCIRSDPWKDCPFPDECFAVFANGVCDPKCNNRACKFDGMDCDIQKEPTDGQCNPLFEVYCSQNYGNGFCDQGCNNAECGWDGLDCVDNKTRAAAALPGSVSITLDVDYRQLELFDKRDINRVLRSLSNVVTGSVFELKRIYRDKETGKGALELQVNEAVCDLGDKCSKSVIEVEEYMAALQSTQGTFSQPLPGSATKLYAVQAVGPSYTKEGDDGLNPNNMSLGVIISTMLGLVLCGVILGVIYQTGIPSPNFGNFTGKIRKEKGITWFPEGFPRPATSRQERRSGAAARAAGGDFNSRRPRLAGLAGLSGYSDAQEMHSLSSSTQLMTKEPGQVHEQDVSDSDGHRKMSAYDSIYDEPLEPRPWTLQHLEAYQGRTAGQQTQLFSPPLYDTLKARTPTSPHAVSSPFGNGPMSPGGIGVDVRGPGGLTPLMVASAYDSQTLFCQQTMAQMSTTAFPASPSTLLLENNVAPGDLGSPPPTQTDIIGELLSSGASLTKQNEITGETPLHMAARYSRADAAKRLLDAGANANAIDFKGRTPLHAAIAADARGVFEILLRNRATNINAQDDQGFTPLIVAVKNSLQDMVEDLVNSEANLDIQDAKGKTALHWAASVNNTAALRTLLAAQANKDAQDHLDQTPLFLACRDGAKEAAQLLLSAGANKDVTDHMDRLPRDVAAELQHRDIVQLLEENSPPLTLYGQTLYGRIGSPQSQPPPLPPVNHSRAPSQDIKSEQSQQSTTQSKAAARSAAAKKAAASRRPSCSSSSSDPTEPEVKPPRSRHDRSCSTLGRNKNPSKAASSHQRSHSAARAAPSSTVTSQSQPQAILPQPSQSQAQMIPQGLHRLQEPIRLSSSNIYTTNGTVIGMMPNGVLLSPPSSSSPLSSSFSPASSSHALSPHTSIASPYSTSSHVSSPPHHQTHQQMPFPPNIPGPFGPQAQLVQTSQHVQQLQPMHLQPLPQQPMMQQQVPPPAYDEVVGDQVSTYFTTLRQQVHGGYTTYASVASDSAYLTPSPDSPENGLVDSPDPPPVSHPTDWAFSDVAHQTDADLYHSQIRQIPSQQSVFI